MNKIINLADSYKYSHFEQYPNNMVSMFDYAEARSGKVYPETVFFGLQYYIKKYLQKKITKKMVKKTRKKAEKHGIPFDYDGWMYIAKTYGYLPVKVRAVQEGELIPTGLPLFSIESEDPRVPWVVGFTETLLMKVWYTSNIATRGHYVKKMLLKYWDKSVETDNMFGINFAFHNFGDRGASSVESAGIGGVALLTQFFGTDNFNALFVVDDFYDNMNDEVAGFSIPATEHSTTTAWGKENEATMIMNHLEKNKGKDIIAGVLDSYDYLSMVDQVTQGEFKEKIESTDYPKFVMRPDSGDPIMMIGLTLDLMELNKVQYTNNLKGYKVFNKYGIIWGDGIDMDNMREILEYVLARGYSAENIAFGSGGWVMTQHDRDTQGWAVKCSSVTVKYGDSLTERDIFKDPITEPNKKSKKGRITTYFNPVTGAWFYDKIGMDFDNGSYDMMKMVYEKGELLVDYKLDDIRAVENF